MTSYWLCTTALPQFWPRDTQASRLFLGKWCFLGYGQYGSVLPGKDVILPYPWDNRALLKEAFGLQQQFYEILLKRLSIFLNDVHGERHGERYWRIIIGPWLINFIQVFHERYVCIKQAYALFPTLATVYLDPSSSCIPRDFVDHFHGLSKDAYNLQLYSSVALQLKIPGIFQTYSWQFKDRERTSFFKKKMAWLSCKLSKRMSIGLASLACPYGMQIKILRHFLSMAPFIALDDLPLQEKDCNTLSSARVALSDLAQGEEGFRACLIRSLPEYFPLRYLEGYQPFRTWVLKNWDFDNPRLLLSATDWESKEIFKFIAAHRAENKSRLIAVQHGGSYGIADYNPNEALEKAASDEFWSWGWQDQSSKTIKIMPSLKLSFLKQKNYRFRKKREFILYVANEVPRYHYRTWSMPIASQYERCLNWRLLFLQSLHHPVQKRLLYRPYVHDYGWHFTAFLNKEVPWLAIQEQKANYTASLLSARLVICDANQTTLLECLAADIPVVAYWDPDLWEIRQEALEEVALLFKAGILFYDPQAAASAVNQYSGQADWWLSPSAQEARRVVASKFALTNPNCTQKWASHFKVYRDINQGKPILS